MTKRARDLLGITDTQPLRGEPKTQRSRRVVELPSLAVDALRRNRDAAKVVTVDGRVITTADGRLVVVPTVYNSGTASWCVLASRWCARMTHGPPRPR